MGAAEPEETFKITDRRRRGGDEPPAVEPRVEPAPAPRPSSVPPTPAAVSPPTAHSERSLVGLFVMLGDYALEALGETDAATGAQGPPDLASAAELIDVLITLREKTEGRRSPEESQALDELLYELQLRYVNARRRLG